ncbi:MAG: SIR2 family protein [Candidatus Heimdallarchaeota archaeon]
MKFLNKAESEDLDSFAFLVLNAYIGRGSQGIHLHPFTLFTNSPEILSLQDQQARELFKQEIHKLREYIKSYVVERCFQFKKEKIDSLCEPLFNFFFDFLKITELWVATTNYDPIIEEYCKKSGIELICGFEHSSTYPEGIWKPEKFGEFRNERNIRLVKLHGSCTWYKLNNQLLRIDAGINVLPGKGIKPTNVVIYPAEEEEILDEPYVSLFRIFSQVLFKKIDGCIVIGYSFRDKRITSIFQEALKRIHLMVVDPQAKVIVEEFKDRKDKIIPVNEELTEGNLERLKRKFIDFLNKL